jgi:hypothetical protein
MGHVHTEKCSVITLHAQKSITMKIRVMKIQVSVAASLQIMRRKGVKGSFITVTKLSP